MSILERAKARAAQIKAQMADKRKPATETQIRVSMANYDNLPQIARDIAKEFSIADMNAVRRELELIGPMTDRCWRRVWDRLNEHRRRVQEEIYALGPAAFQPKSPVLRSANQAAQGAATRF